MFDKDNLPQLDDTTGPALKTRPMLATVMLTDAQIPAPWGGLLSGVAGLHAYMIQAMNNGKGAIDGYFNNLPQMFNDYHVLGRADEMSDEDLAAVFEDMPERLAHIRKLFPGSCVVFIMQRTKANQTLLGRAQEGGTFNTHEGPVDFDAGAYLNQDSKGQIWPIDQATFKRDYKIVA